MRDKKWIESEITDDQYEVKVTVTVGLQRRGEHATLRDEVEEVYRALVRGERLPDGTVYYGHEARVFNAKALRRRARKFAKDDAALTGEDTRDA